MTNIENGLSMQSKLTVNAYNDKGTIGIVERIVEVDFLKVLKNMVKNLEGENK